MIDSPETSPDVIFAQYQYNLNVILSEADNAGNASPVGALAAAGPSPISGQTLASGGGGGSSGGGPTGDCVEIGVPVTFPLNSMVTERVVAQNNWIAVAVGNDEPVLMVPETLVAIWVRAKDLKGNELADVGENGELEPITSVVAVQKKSYKVARAVLPSHQYRARRLKVHNLKPRQFEEL